MARRKKSEAPPPGAFVPAPPSDTQEVLRLFVIAARAVSARPDKLAEIEAALERATRGLLPPESLAVEECRRLWRYFRRAAESPKPSLRLEAGRAIYRDLEALGQRLDLPPLQPWDKLPLGLVAQVDDDEDSSPTDVDLEGVRRRARRRRAKGGKAGRLRPEEVADLLRLLGREELERVLAERVGQGFMGRGEGQLVVHWLARGEKLAHDDEALREILGRLGDWLVET